MGLQSALLQAQVQTLNSPHLEEMLLLMPLLVLAESVLHEGLQA